LKLQYDVPLSSFAFNFNLRRYSMAPNVVVYTTLLKGHMLNGDVAAAEVLLGEMPKQKPPVPPDVRAVNTFLRTCQRAGRSLTVCS